MSKLLKLEAITNKHNLTIDYMLTFRCNYNCSYCTSHDINHPLHKYSVEEISESLNYLSSLYKDKKIQLILLGGEPFLYKDLLKLITNLKDTFMRIRITTNLSISLAYIKKNFINFNRDKLRIVASYHPEFSNPDEFIEKILFLQKLNYSIGCTVMMHPDNKLFAKSLYILNKLPKTARAASLWKMDDHNHIFGNVYKYTESQRKEINKFKFIDSQSYVKATYEDKITYPSVNEIILQNLDNFKGMKCYAGYEKLHITENGDVYPSACFLKYPNVRLGNMFKKTVRVPTSIVTCPFTFCRCDTDVRITKETQK